MSRDLKITELATRAGAEAKAIRSLLNGNAPDLSGLNTTDKTSLVAAANEIKGALDALANAGIIDDAATVADKVWSSEKIVDYVLLQINGLKDGAPGVMDTLNEIAAALGDDENFAASVNAALSNRVRFDAPQTLSTAQKLTASTNIGMGDPEANFVAAFEGALN